MLFWTFDTINKVDFFLNPHKMGILPFFFLHMTTSMVILSKIFVQHILKRIFPLKSTQL